MRDPLFEKYLTAVVEILSWKVVLAVVLMGLVSLSEGIGLMLLIPLLQQTGLDVYQGSLGTVARFLSRAFEFVHLEARLPTVLGFYLTVAVLIGCLSRWESILKFQLVYRFVSALRLRLYDAVGRTSWEFFARLRSSSIAHVLTTEVERVGAATFHLMQLVSLAAISLTYIGFAFALSWGMTAVVFVAGILLLLAQRRQLVVARAAGRDTSEETRGLFAAISEHLSGMKTARCHGLDLQLAESFSAQTSKVKVASLRSVFNQADTKFRLDLGHTLILGAILYASIELVQIAAAEVLLLLYLYARLMPRLSGVLQSYQGFMNLLPAYAAVSELEEECVAAPVVRTSHAQDIELREGIHLKGVSFQHDRPVLEDLTLSVEAGRVTAIVGPSGAGKSTIAELVIGLIQPHRGSVWVDNTPLAPEHLSSWRRQIGYVSQDGFLFHDTVRANLLWANPQATAEQIKRALCMASAGFVERLPERLDTIVGDRGILLSAGEKQRLAIARALIREPSLLILDEATSQLDSENEENVLNAMDQLRGYTTILTIGHRPSTVHRADTIHILDAGTIIESGPWNELTKRVGGRFPILSLAHGVEADLDGQAPPARSASEIEGHGSGHGPLTGTSVSRRLDPVANSNEGHRDNDGKGQKQGSAGIAP